jgi:hypothetical protein
MELDFTDTTKLARRWPVAEPGAKGPKSQIVPCVPIISGRLSIELQLTQTALKPRILWGLARKTPDCDRLIKKFNFDATQ